MSPWWTEDLLEPERVEPLKTIAHRDLLGVGQLTPSTARFWMRPTQPGTYRVDVFESGGRRVGSSRPFVIGADHDQTFGLDYPKSREEGSLHPATKYHAELLPERSEDSVARVTFETSPLGHEDCPNRFAFAVASCHQPFTDAGQVNSESLKMLQALEHLVADEALKGLILLGDQMYADQPQAFSLFDPDYFSRVAPEGCGSVLDCSRVQVRHLYQERFRRFWSVPHFKETLGRVPCFLMHDDHEIIDNFGAAPEHSSAEFSNLRAGALDASFDYQGLWRAERATERPDSCHFDFTYGPLSVFVMDLRSQKRATADTVVMCADSQLQALREFLVATRAQPIVALGLSVPLVHLPDWLASAGDKLVGQDSDAADRWSHARAAAFRHRFLGILRRHQEAHPEQHLILLGGDVHCGVVTRLDWPDTNLGMTQLVSSAVSNLESPLKRALAEWVPALLSGMTVGDDEHQLRCELLAGRDGAERNPIGDLNVGVVAVERRGTGWSTRLKLFQQEEAWPVLVFESPEL